MATGRLGAADLAATTLTNVFQVTAAKTASFSVSLCNRNSTSVTVRLALASTSASPTAAEWLEYDTTILANSVLERTGLALDATKYLVAYAGSTGVSAVAYGYED